MKGRKSAMDTEVVAVASMKRKQSRVVAVVAVGFAVVRQRGLACWNV